MMALNRPEPPSLGSVASLLAMDRTTLTAALKPLERRALVETKLHPRDRRSRVLSLTPQGMALLAQAVPAWTEVHAALNRQLAAHDSDRLRSVLRALS